MKKFFLIMLVVLAVLNTFNYRKHIKESPLNKVVDFYVYYETTKDFFSYNISPYFAVLPKVKSEGQYFIYPPTFLIFFSPVALIPLQIAQWLWVLLNIFIFFGISYWFAIKILNRNKKLQKPILLLMVYNFNPFFLCVFFGQVDIIILFFLYVSFYLIFTGRKELTGIAVGFITLIKLTPGVFALYFLLKRDIKAILWFVSTISLFIILSLLIFPSGIYSDFFSALRTINEHLSRYIIPLNKSVFALFGRVFLDNRLFSAVIVHSPVLFNLFYFVTVISFLTIIYLRSSRLNDMEMFALTILLAVIILPNALVYSLVFVFPALIIFYEKIKTFRGFVLLTLIFLSLTFHYSLYFIVPFHIVADFIPLFGNILLFTCIAGNIC